MRIEPQLRLRRNDRGEWDVVLGHRSAVRPAVKAVETVYASMDQIGWDDKSRPAEQRSRAQSLEEVLEKPIPGVKFSRRNAAYSSPTSSPPIFLLLPFYFLLASLRGNQFGIKLIL